MLSAMVPDCFDTVFSITSPLGLKVNSTVSTLFYSNHLPRSEPFVEFSLSEDEQEMNTKNDNNVKMGNNDFFIFLI
jgi:hypothetical protein